jgi:cytochrome c oxidase subunit 2
MLGVHTVLSFMLARFPVAHAGDVRAPADVFNDIFTVFLVLGTAVGVVVVGYTLYNAYKYRDGDGAGVDADVDRPQMGELPTGGGGGKKRFLSLTISAIIVVGLILWTYVSLLYIETGPSSQQAQQQALDNAGIASASQASEANATGELDPITIEVIGHQFSWEFVYPNGHSTTGELRVPQNRLIRLNVTSADVFHNFGSPELRFKADAVPGQETHAWFVAKQTGTYEAHCYELCGSGHSYMNADIRVVTQNGYDQWYAETGGSGSETEQNETTATETDAAQKVMPR